jgi:micrococcal nuclease
VIAALPTVTPPEEPAAPRAGYAAASLAALEPLRAVTSLPTVMPPREPKEPERTGCDPAYPEERTCIPPGPPFDQGCAITSERRFEVLSPDPQRLDHDGDGIGCEPIRAST